MSTAMCRRRRPARTKPSAHAETAEISAPGSPGSSSLGIGGAVALTVAASVVAWLFLDRVASVQRRVNEGSVPEMVAAFGVAQHAGNLVAAAPRLTTAADPRRSSPPPPTVSTTLIEALAGRTRRAAAGGRRLRRPSRTRPHPRGHPFVQHRGDRGIGMTELFPLARTERRAARRAGGAARHAWMNWWCRQSTTSCSTPSPATIPWAQPPARRAPSTFRSGNWAVIAALPTCRRTAASPPSSWRARSIFQDASSIEPLRERFESAAGPHRAQPGGAGGVAAARRSGADLRPAAGAGTGGRRERFRPAHARTPARAGASASLLARNRDLTVELVAEVDELVDTAHGRTRAGDAGIDAGDSGCPHPAAADQRRSAWSAPC